MKSLLSHAAIFLVALLLGIGATAYWLRYRGESHSFQSSLPYIFSDFQLVAESNQDWYIPTHGANGNPLPTTLNVGRTYILHRQPALSDAVVFEQTLSRMRSKGINIEEADDGSRIRKDGLAFRITFSDGVYAGYLQRYLSKGDPDDDPKDICPFLDYVLVITQARLG